MSVSKEDLQNALANKKCRFSKLGKKCDFSKSTKFNISSHLGRCDDFRGCPTVFGTNTNYDPVNAVVDGVHWASNKKYDRVCICVPDENLGVESKQALATMVSAVRWLDVTLCFYRIVNDFIQVTLEKAELPKFLCLPRLCSWAESLESRKTAKIPAIGLDLQNRLVKRVPSFRWYRSVTGKGWSGRVAGWEFCELKDGHTEIHWGETDKDRKSNPPITSSNLTTLVSEIIKFASARANPTSKAGKTKHEHLLESCILRQGIPVMLPNNGRLLIPVIKADEPPFQFPALFSDKGNPSAKYIDVLMRDGDTPWVLELKVATNGEGQYYRHAITQAVLYREFLRRATPLHKWFHLHAIDPVKTRSAIGFPHMKDKTSSNRMQQLRRTARFFDVEVIELPDKWADLHKKCMK